MAFVLVLVLAAAVQLVQVDNQLDLGNGDFYLRNAQSYANGTLARSRYSPGLGLFLAPIARLAGDDHRLLTLVAELTMVVVTVSALLVLYQLLRTYVAPWPAVIMLGAFSLGQAAVVFLSGAEAEALSLLLVSSCLLALARDRPWWVVALGALAVVVRVALAPFVGVLFLLLLLRHRRAGAAGVMAVLAAAAAHFASGPTVDQSYIGIGRSVYSRGDGGVVGVLARAAAERAGDYLRFGIPRLVVPFRVLSSPVGPIVSVLVIAAIVLGILQLRRDRRKGAQGPEALAFDAACLGSIALLGVLLFWPIRAGESTRLLIPIAVVPLVGLGRYLEALLRGGRTIKAGGIVAAFLALLLVINVGSTPLVLAARGDPTSSASRFFAVHEEAKRLAWLGPVVSRKPAVTELITRRVSYAYPVGDSVPDLEAFSHGSKVCTFVVDELFNGMPESLAGWIAARQDRVIAANGGTRIVTIRAPWCPSAS